MSDKNGEPPTPEEQETNNNNGGVKMDDQEIFEDAKEEAGPTMVDATPLVEKKSPRPGRRVSYLDNLVAARTASEGDGTLMATTTEEEEEDDEEEDADEEKTTEKKLRRISQRVSMFQAKLGSERLVEVRMQNVSYHVPVRADAPTVKTVWNQTPCYTAYRFFRRIHLYREWKRAAEAAKTATTARLPKTSLPKVPGRWKPKAREDIFMPYQKKTILTNVNLLLQPGSSYLILGPPGCGKTSLLKAIAGALPGSKTDALKDKPYFEGRVEYNGLASQDDPKLVLPNIASYVEQHDFHSARLTVKETFDFAFQCRTGGSLQSKGLTDSAVMDLDDGKSDEHVQENLTIEGLGLAHVADTFVGDNNIRGVSGGQRRRVTVGEMMQGHNPVACADEISTGLDAAVTYDICRSIVAFAKAAKTTRIVSLLQPGPEVFSLFDEVIILSEGHVVYAGPVSKVVDYFDDLGYTLPATVDVADFLCQLPTPDGALYYTAPEGGPEEHLTTEEMAKAFRESDIGERLIDRLNMVNPVKWKGPSNNSSQDDDEERGGMNTVDTPDEFHVEFQNSWGKAFKLNLNRHITLWKRDKGFIIGKVFENIGMAVATGGILFGQARVKWETGAELTPAIADQALKLMAAVYGALYMASFHITQGSQTAAPDELDGRPVHYKHADANFYQTTAFVVSRLISTFPQRALDITAFGLPVYWMVGLTAKADAFFIYLLLLLWLIICEKMLFGITTSLIRTKQNVLGIGSFVVLMQLLFGGFIVFPDAIPNYYKWAYYINPFAWTYQGLLVNEFTSTKYDPATGRSFLSGRGFQTERAWIGYAFAFLIPFSLLCTIVQGVALKRVRFESAKPKGEGSLDDLDESDYDANTFSLPFTPVDLTFKEISYEVQASTGKEIIRILTDVSGCFRAGRLCALMGSSGAGKTTLMDVVAMRKESGEIGGEIKLNGHDQERVSFLRCSGYVEQFDVPTPELTVRETIAFAARLRLDSNNPATKEDADKMKFVDSILRLLELTPIEKDQVGSYEEGGLTFEQRKRVAIGVELAGSPSVLFLDEPTSGLDARAALLVMRLLKRIADTGRTVCSTIHQPSSAVFEMFDDLMLLKTGGRVVFFGELGENSVHLINYFESNGGTPIEHGDNPSSWMLRVLDEKPDWEEVYKSSPKFETAANLIEEINESPDESNKIHYEEQYPTTLRKRIQLMNRRVNMIYLRSPAYNLTRVMVSVFYAFLIGSVFLAKTARNEVWRENEVEGVLGTLFLSLTSMGVMCITMVVPVMKQIRDVFYKHRASGMIEHTPLTISLSLGEAPYICVVSVLFAAVYYGTVGLFSGAKNFGQYWVFFALNLAIYTYLGQSFMCLVKDIPTAGALMGALIGYNVFFSGFVVKPQYFVGPFQLGYWTAPGRFAFEGIVVTQFNDLELPVEAQTGSPWFFNQGCTLNQTEPCQGTMNDYVGFTFGGRFKESDVPIAVGALCGYMVLSWIVTHLALKKFNYVNT